ncbi:MAG: UDP-N-acetylmuramate dehydrogenase [Flavobacteriales bacterium]
MHTHANLQPFNTFGIQAQAAQLAEAHSVDEMRALIDAHGTPDLVLGGGSNVLLRGDVDGFVLVNRIPGVEVVSQEGDRVRVRVGGGVVWHDFVLHCIDQGWAGVENLSLIPGSVGAAPMQNIGAYGVEIKDVFHRLEALHIASGEVHTFNHQECAFGYRESVFKRALKGQHIISHVEFDLSLTPTFHTEYGAIQAELQTMGVTELSIRAISDAVIRIRQSKLPDPAQIGNAGSFFKNPVVPHLEYERIREAHPNVVAYPAGEGHMKLAAGWLIDQAGWKGHLRGTHGVHDRQALVLVNHGGAQGQEIWQLSEDILQDVKTRYGVTLEREVNIIG